jgi:hypothetical protein
MAICKKVGSVGIYGDPQDQNGVNNTRRNMTRPGQLFSLLDGTSLDFFLKRINVP